MRHDLVTLDAVKAQMTTTGTSGDATLQRLITKASVMVAKITQRSFLPARETKTLDARGSHIDGARLLLPDDLLEVISLVDGTGTSVASHQYALRPLNMYPKYRIDLLDSSGLWWGSYTTDWQGAISITGVWGYHDDWPHAWIDTLDTVQGGGVNNSTTSLTVVDAAGGDEVGRQRFEIGTLLRVDDEFMRVTAVNTDTNVLTVLRGQRGTTASAHDEATSLFRWSVMDDIEQATIALSIWLERNKETVGEKVQLLGGGEIRTMQAPDYIKATLDRYARIGSLL